jgi:hypothetical protein
MDLPWYQRRHTSDGPSLISTKTHKWCAFLGINEDTQVYQWRHTSDGPSLISTKTHKWCAFLGINEDTQVMGFPWCQRRHTSGEPSWESTKTRVSTKTHKWRTFLGINEDTHVMGLPWYQWRHTSDGPSTVSMKTHTWWVFLDINEDTQQVVDRPWYQRRHTSNVTSLVSTKTHKWWAFLDINEDTQVMCLPWYQWRHTSDHPVHTAPSTALPWLCCYWPLEIGPIPMRTTASTGGSIKPRLYCYRSTQYIVHLCRRRHSCQRGTNTIALLCLVCSFSTQYPSHVSWGLSVVWRSDATPGSSGWQAIDLPWYQWRPTSDGPCRGLVSTKTHTKWWTFLIASYNEDTQVMGLPRYQRIHKWWVWLASVKMAQSNTIEKQQIDRYMYIMVTKWWSVPVIKLVVESGSIGLNV